MDSETGKTERTWTEEFEVTGTALIERIKELVRAGNVRRVILRTQDNKLLLEIPLTAGAVAYPSRQRIASLGIASSIARSRMWKSVA